VAGPELQHVHRLDRAHVPELELDLPATAIGKDYLGSTVFSTAPSARLSVLARRTAWHRGERRRRLEVNLLGLNFGVGPSGLKLPSSAAGSSYWGLERVSVMIWPRGASRNA